MRVNERMHVAAHEALDLVRAGKPLEATAAIQRKPGGLARAARCPNRGRFDDGRTHRSQTAVRSVHRALP